MSLQANTSKSASLMSHINTELLQLKTREASYSGTPDTSQLIQTITRKGNSLPLREASLSKPSSFVSFGFRQLKHGLDVTTWFLLLVPQHTVMNLQAYAKEMKIRWMLWCLGNKKNQEIKNNHNCIIKLDPISSLP